MAIFLQCIDRLPAGERDKIRRQLPAADLELVTAKTSPEWVDAAMNVRWVRAVSQALEPESFDKFFREMMRRDFDDSFLNGFVAGVLRLFGGNVGVLVKRVPAGFALMWRDVGHVEALVVAEMEIHMVFTDVAPELMDDRWFASVSASLSGLFAILEVPGRAEVAEYDVTARKSVVSLQWFRPETPRDHRSF